MAIVDKYNKEVAEPNGMTLLDREVLKKGSANQRVELPCLIEQVGDSSYGKFEK